jgi:methylated-DNA-[protein]-cysteine S-methyltransferase
MTTKSDLDTGLLGALRAAVDDLPPGADRRMHERLAERAEGEGILDVAYRVFDSPFGPLLLAATAGGLVRVGFEVEGHDLVLARLAELVSPRILEAPARLDRAASQLDEYFAGRRRRFELPLDLQLARGFRLQVLELLPAIAYGTTESYASVAAAAGRPAAVRAAAGACSHNPLPLVIPCHRVVRSDGSLGGYLGGPEVKRTLLELEASR